MQDSTAPRDRLDHDPAGSSFPPSATVPEVIRERHEDEPEPERPELARTIRRVFDFGDSEFERGARELGLAVHHALEHPRVNPAEVAATLQVLDRPDYVPAVLRSLRALANRQLEPGGGS